jgi:hypothetical protein
LKIEIKLIIVWFNSLEFKLSFTPGNLPANVCCESPTRKINVVRVKILNYELIIPTAMAVSINLHYYEVGETFLEVHICISLEFLKN